MEVEGFKFENCLLKHFIRREVWLPICQERFKRVQSPGPQKGRQGPRRLRYFTFCAVGALDVLMLARARILRRSSGKEFDTVYFFDRTPEQVTETQLRIPGARGFPGDFVDVTLNGDSQALQKSIGPDAPDTRETRKRQQLHRQFLSFQDGFPFDVMNLDVEQYLYKPREELPGKLTNTLRRLFEFQKRPLSSGEQLSEFTLMFTTPVGPHELPPDYMDSLREGCLVDNLSRYPQLREPYLARSSGREPGKFFDEDFESAFKLAVPKSLVELARESDWHVDQSRGVAVYEFHRETADGKYCMLHMAMNIIRASPPREKRPPGRPAVNSEIATEAVLVNLFAQAPVSVETALDEKKQEALRSDLRSLFNFRATIYKPIEN